MLIDDLQTIGNRFLLFRKRAGLTQGEVAERAGLSDRTYADIERGTVNMRLSTILRICNVFHVSPNDILTADDEPSDVRLQEAFDKLQTVSEAERKTALNILNAYLQSL